MKTLVLISAVLLSYSSFAEFSYLKFEKTRTNDFDVAVKELSKSELIDMCIFLRKDRNHIDAEREICLKMLKGIIYSNDIDVRMMVSDTNVFNDISSDFRAKKEIEVYRNNPELVRSSIRLDAIMEGNGEKDEKLIEALKADAEKIKKLKEEAEMRADAKVHMYLDCIGIYRYPRQANHFRKNIYKIEKFKH